MYVMIVVLNFRVGKGNVQPVKRGIRLVKCGEFQPQIPQKMIVLAGMQEKLAQKSKRFLKLAYKKHRVSPVDLKN